MANAPEVLEASRLDKLRQIEALGLDPWGGRFDGVMPIAQVRGLPHTDDKERQPKVRVAGRIRLRRGHGNLHFLHLWDQTGEVQIAIGK